MPCFRRHRICLWWIVFGAFVGILSIIHHPCISKSFRRQLVPWRLSHFTCCLGFATLGRADEISRHGTAVPRWWLRMLPRETITIYLLSFSPRCKSSRQLSPERHLSPSHPRQLPSFSSADDVPPQPRAKPISHWIAERKPRHVMH
ncbi:hypothetical protein I7I48_07653 [Histoplasma ohiense]|nr:hypothetical protein I7I48_07653 [Histoplasma ohiense (nom. inval.)]